MNRYYTMPATSKSQQRLFGIVHSCQKNKNKNDICDSPNIKKLTKDVKKKDAKDFAKTKHKDLPEKVEENLTCSSFNSWLALRENRNRTGLKFGYPDGYYRSQYPGLYSTPISATAALDLENEKRMPASKRENKTGLPDVVNKPKGLLNFPEHTSFSDWRNTRGLNEGQGAKMKKDKCECACDGCKKGDCKKCSCKKCKCKNCKCCK